MQRKRILARIVLEDAEMREEAERVWGSSVAAFRDSRKAANGEERDVEADTKEYVEWIGEARRDCMEREGERES